MSGYMHGDATYTGEPPSITRLLSLLPAQPYEMALDRLEWGPVIKHAAFNGLVTFAHSRFAWVLGRRLELVLVSRSAP